MSRTAWLICFGTFAVSVVLTGLVRRSALSSGLLDIPNQRSSHSVPTPRGGGVAIVAASMLGFLVLMPFDGFSFGLLATLVGGGAAVAGIGYLDDRRPLSARLRLVVHFAAAIWAVFWLDHRSDLQAFTGFTLSGAGLLLLEILTIVWCLNLFNFMDGIDGIAASEALFVAVAGAALSWYGGGGMEVSALALTFAAACGGFLLWNWPPAKIFMGDVGSGYCGYQIGVVALAASQRNAAEIWIWLILAGVFFVDATVTLVRRAVRGERVFQAHRSHAYQWLARKWSSHRRVTVGVALLNLLWLLPWAFMATRFPQSAFWIACVALIPLIVLAVLNDAGKREVS